MMYITKYCVSLLLSFVYLFVHLFYFFTRRRGDFICNTSGVLSVSPSIFSATSFFSVFFLFFA